MFGADTDKTAGHATKPQITPENMEGHPMNDGSGIAARIEQLRLERGWSQAQLSERAGLGKGAVNDLANHPERNPRPQTVAAIARALGVDAAYLEGVARSGGVMSRDHVTDIMHGAGGLGALGVGGIVAYDIPNRDPVRASRDIALVDTMGEGRSGDPVLIETGSGLQIGQLAEPYVVTFGAGGELQHLIRGAAGCRVIGRIVSRLSIY